MFFDEVLVLVLVSPVLVLVLAGLVLIVLVLVLVALILVLVLAQSLCVQSLLTSLRSSVIEGGQVRFSCEFLDTSNYACHVPFL